LVSHGEEGKETEGVRGQMLRRKSTLMRDEMMGIGEIT
jgi:hypothetical protein